jgi:hypothetical protein
MTTIETSIEIGASAARVWEILTDFVRYAEWNPFITSISGSPAAGEKLKVRIQPPGRAAMTFRPTVLAAEPSRELRWKGKFLINGLFDGEHYFCLTPSARGTLLEQGERFGGLLVPLLRETFAATEQGFKAMNEQLKRRAEA